MHFHYESAECRHTLEFRSEEKELVRRHVDAISPAMDIVEIRAATAQFLFGLFGVWRAVCRNTLPGVLASIVLWIWLIWLRGGRRSRVRLLVTAIPPAAAGRGNQAGQLWRQPGPYWLRDWWWVRASVVGLRNRDRGDGHGLRPWRRVDSMDGERNAEGEASEHHPR